ncbi:MAG: hypothetical protein ACRYFK_07425 [Janthinobacterium lividum]
MNLAITPTQVKLLTQPLDEFFHGLSSPASLSKTLNRLLFNHLRLGNQLLPDETENLNALFDFLLACQVAHGGTFIVAEA